MNVVANDLSHNKGQALKDIDEQNKNHAMLYIVHEKENVKENSGTGKKKPLKGKGHKKEILRLAHFKNMHFGYKKMKNIIVAHTGEIENLPTKVKLYIKDCELCQRRNICMKCIPKAKPVIYEIPGQNISIDLIGSISLIAADRRKYILSVIGSISRYCYIILLKSYMLNDLALLLLNRVFCYHEFPKAFRSDERKNFRIKRTFKWIADTVAKVVREQPNYKPEYLPMVMFYYNSMKNVTTGCS
uniref:Integrase catalytic domain-containing protein n=1 Tax=Strongyloides venezuelensis TaxID=75913 RepID=A0A0K0F0M7_STRVS